MDTMYVYMSDFPGLYEVEMPDGRQLLDLTGGQIVHLAEKYRCQAQLILRGPQVYYLPTMLHHAQA